MGSVRFSTTLQARGHAAAVVLDDEHVEQIGEASKRFPVQATMNGYTWRTTVARMGGEFLLGLNKAVRDAVDAQAGDSVDVSIELDSAPREVEIPDALASALAMDPAAKAAFDALSFTNRKEYARAVAEAKRPETRDRRVAQTLEKLWKMP
jgi:Bacteriocin-protection, YdeI or OmpD-Associated/Domain of unknown function (DUF1905)